MSSDPPIPFQDLTKFELISQHEPDDGFTPITPFSFQECNGRFSLIFVVDRENHKVLLGNKKRGFGVGIIHGFGGKIEANETMIACAERELQEESGLKAEPDHLYPMGRLLFTRPGPTLIDIALFAVDKWTQEPRETDEMSPAWFSLDTFDPVEASNLPDGLPFDNMWPDVRLYFQPLLKSFISHKDQRRLFARIDYDFVDPNTHEIRLPAVRNSRAGDRQEMIVAWWMAYA